MLVLPAGGDNWLQFEKTAARWSFFLFVWLYPALLSGRAVMKGERHELRHHGAKAS